MRSMGGSSALFLAVAFTVSTSSMLSLPAPCSSGEAPRRDPSLGGRRRHKGGPGGRTMKAPSRIRRSSPHYVRHVKAVMHSDSEAKLAKAEAKRRRKAARGQMSLGSSRNLSTSQDLRKL